MAHCHVKDCPAPSIDYITLEKLPDGISACPFCFARLSTKIEVLHQFKPMKKATVSGLTKIPPLEVQNTLFSEFKEKNSVIFADASSTEINQWNSIRDVFSQKLGHIFPQIKNIRIISFRYSPRLLITGESAYLLKFIQNVDPSSASLAQMIFRYFRPLLVPELNLKISLLPFQIQHWIINTFPFIKEQSLNEWSLELTPLSEKSYLLTDAIDLNIENLNTRVLSEEFGKLSYISWLVGKVDIIESCLFSIGNRNDISLFLFNTDAINLPFDSLIEKTLYQQLPLYMPYLLDYVEIFLESSRVQKLQIQKRLVSDPELKDLFDKFYKEKNIKNNLNDLSTWPDFDLYKSKDL